MTIEEEVRNKLNEEIAEFAMPKPCLGQSVKWYGDGTKNNKGEIAFVREVGKRNLVLGLSSGIRVDRVRHVDDPKLSLSADQRATGAWDFTDEAKQYEANLKRLDGMEATVKAMQDRIATLEEFLNEPAKKKADKS
jgi:hypothetical protein